MKHNRLALALLMVALLVGCAGPVRSPGLPLAVESVPMRPIPKTLGVMFSFEGDNLQTKTGVVASVVVFETWERVAPGPGQFNPDALNKVVDRYKGMTVTLLDGSVVPVPIVTQIIPYLSGAPDQPTGVDFSDRTPQWLYERGVPHVDLGGKLVGYALECPSGRVAELPRYDSAEWWAAWHDTVRQFAQWAESQPQVVGIVAAVGLDGETQPVKNWGSCAYATYLAQIPGLERAWALGVEQTIKVYGEAFGPTGIT